MIGYKEIIVLTVLGAAFGIVMDKLGIVKRLAAFVPGKG